MAGLRFSSLRIKPFLFLVALLVEQVVLYAQEDNNSVVLTYTKSQASATDDVYFVVRHKVPLPADIKPVRILDEFHSIIDSHDAATLQKMQGSFQFYPANDLWKYSPAMTVRDKYAKNLSKYIVATRDSARLSTVLRTLQEQVRVIQYDKVTGCFLLETSAKTIEEKIVPLSTVFFVDRSFPAHTETGIIGYDRGFHGMSLLDHQLPNANGKNIVAGIKEQRLQEQDLDLHKRVLASTIAAPNIEPHATVIASIVGGAGNSFYDGRGIAHQVSFFSSSFSNLFPDDAAVLNAAKVTVQNHSYGTVIQQFYGAEAAAYDQQTWNNKNLVHVFSAGNRGSSFATEGKYANIAGHANLTGNFKMAKNIITVAAIDNRDNVSPESSSGPAYDGRIAPQLTALGPNGTSDAAAMVTGTIAVMQQVFKDSNLSLPPASLIKAILYNSATDIYRKGIDYKTGYGLLNSYEAVLALQGRRYDAGQLINNQTWTRTLPVVAGASQLKITLCWTDSAASLNNNKALINDLDLEVEEMNTGTIFRPWVLSSTANRDSLAAAPLRRRDSLNTSEQVSIEMPAAGNYIIRVKAASIQQSIPFHIAYQVDTLHSFSFTNPMHTSDLLVPGGPQLRVRWKTFVADTSEVGDLYVSYDSGTNWRIIQRAIKLYPGRFDWNIPDTISAARLKMSTAFGDFQSGDFIIGPLTKIKVDFNCTDSTRLSWDKHIYANGYRLFLLTDSPYLKPFLFVNDSFITIRPSQLSSRVFAVQPVLTNGIEPARSVAINIDAQGVNCFYKSFYYNLIDRNELELILDLSFPQAVDSIYFEEVTENGSLSTLR